MEILLDTHIILWAFESSNSLLQSVREMILEKENAIYYSVVSTWEVAIKHMVHPDKMFMSVKDFSECCKNAGYLMLPVLDKHVYAMETLFVDL